jgi:hypothetical protein
MTPPEAQDLLTKLAGQVVVHVTCPKCGDDLRYTFDDKWDFDDQVSGTVASPHGEHFIAAHLKASTPSLHMCSVRGALCTLNPSDCSAHMRVEGLG